MYLHKAAYTPLRGQLIRQHDTYNIKKFKISSNDEKSVLFGRFRVIERYLMVIYP